MAKDTDPVQLRDDTLLAYTSYLQEAEAGFARTLAGDGPFLWSDGSRERAAEVRKGKCVAQFWSGKRPISVPHGLIHDWIGAVWIPGTTIPKTLALIQDYDNHKNIYKPEVIDSRLIRRDGDDFEIYLRLLKKKIVTVVLETDHAVHYSSLDPARWCCTSHTTRISEVEDPGKPEERSRPPDTGHGFLWRLSSYWRFQERDDGVVVECRAISLTRDVPKALVWIVEPIVKKLPKESLIATLEATRRALSPAAGAPPPNAVDTDPQVDTNP